MHPASSLYIHIPFCLSKCDYCDFFSIPVGAVPDSYVDALLRELEFHVRCGNVASLDTVYIGGGTPSILSCAQLERLMGCVMPLCAPDAEVTFEANPEDLNPGTLRYVLDNGVNRVSLGVQSLEDGVLGCIHRRSSRKSSLAALELLSQSGAKFSADMIAGLPGQNERTLVDNILEVVSFSPAHMSLYALTLEEGTPLFRHVRAGQVECSAEVIDSQWIAGRDVLESKGYLQYEVSNFAPQGDESRHNMAYWRQMSYIGIGAGATGTMYLCDGAYEGLRGGIRYTNVPSIEKYVSFWQIAEAASSRHMNGVSDVVAEGAPVEMETLDQDMLAFEFYMLGLRTRDGISSVEYERRFSRGVAEDVFEKYHRRGWIGISPDVGGGRRYAMSRDGILFLNTFLSELL